MQVMNMSISTVYKIPFVRAGGGGISNDIPRQIVGLTRSFGETILPAKSFRITGSFQMGSMAPQPRSTQWA